MTRIDDAHEDCIVRDRERFLFTIKLFVFPRRGSVPVNIELASVPLFSKSTKVVHPSYISLPALSSGPLKASLCTFPPSNECSSAE